MEHELEVSWPIIKRKMAPLRLPHRHLISVDTCSKLALLLLEDFQLIEELEKISDPEDLANWTISIFADAGLTLHLITCAIRKEIEKASDEAILFRETTFATKIISIFCKKEGRAYLYEVLNPLLQMLTVDDVSIEVDPNKISLTENIEENLTMFLLIAKGFIHHLFRGIDELSSSMRTLFRITSEEVEKKFPNSRIKAIGGFYFLRFLCPALVLPDQYGLVSHKPTDTSQRSLVLLTKLIQNLSNQVEFGEKEQYMVKTNSFIRNNEASMVEFLEKIASPPKAPDNVDKIEQMECLYDLISPTDVDIALSELNDFIINHPTFRKSLKESNPNLSTKLEEALEDFRIKMEEMLKKKEEEFKKKEDGKGKKDKSHRRGLSWSLRRSSSSKKLDELDFGSMTLRSKKRMTVQNAFDNLEEKELEKEISSLETDLSHLKQKISAAKAEQMRLEQLAKESHNSQTITEQIQQFKKQFEELGSNFVITAKKLGDARQVLVQRNSNNAKKFSSRE